MNPKLTAKQQRFVAEYLVDLNAKQAAIRAGYSPRSAETNGNRLLRNAQVAAAVEAAKAERQARTEITADAVLQRLAAVAFGDVRELFGEDGSLKPVGELSEAAAAMLASLDVVMTLNDDGSVTRTSKVRLNDRLRALELLGKHLGMFEPKAAPGSAENPIQLLIQHAQGTALPVVANPPPDDEDDDHYAAAA